jgi:5-methylcytosine-specific restriction endonuclease McrA
LSKKAQIKSYKRGKLRDRLHQAQRGRCAWCGGTFQGDKPTFDHVIPRAKGGAHRDNVVLAHFRCNQERDDRLPTGCELIVLAVIRARYEAIRARTA